MNGLLNDLMHEATRLTREGRLAEATATIQRALRGAGGAAPTPDEERGDVVIEGDFVEIDGHAAPASRRLDDGDAGRVDPRAPGRASRDASTHGASTAADDRVTAPGDSGPTPDTAPRRGTDPLGTAASPVADADTSRPEDEVRVLGDAGGPAPSRHARGSPGPAGEFVAGSHAHGSMSRDYRLYLPPGPIDAPRPLVVMLHGCTQDPEDFAAGTAMNERAREQGFFVLYPAQSGRANPQRCWNWFKHTHQRRNRGEAGLIASMVRDVTARHAIDASRVYIAGLSAGGAMAAIVAAAHPELFAAVGVHSGLAPGAATSLPEALAAMQGRDATSGIQGLTQAPGGPDPSGLPDLSALPDLPGLRDLPALRDLSRRAALRAMPGRDHAAGRPARDTARAGGSSAPGPTRLSVPVIVFHGDQDRTVHPRNGERVVEAAAGGDRAGAPPMSSPRTHRGTSPGGRGYTRTVHASVDGDTLAEHWVVHGAGHAWSGGRPAGSYTDAGGPDATAEMLRFFLARRLAPSE
jgi:poly(hydroxyalkanoate) depolymerase family esterase